MQFETPSRIFIDKIVMLSCINKRDSKNNAVCRDKGEINAELIIKAGRHLSHNGIRGLHDTGYYSDKDYNFKECYIERHHYIVKYNPTESSAYHHDCSECDAHAGSGLHFFRDAEEYAEA